MKGCVLQLTALTALQEKTMLIFFSSNLDIVLNNTGGLLAVICRFLCGLLYDAHSNSDYIASNGRMIDWYDALERIWKESIVVQWMCNPGYAWSAWKG
jgi:hypothetical protein